MTSFSSINLSTSLNQQYGLCTCFRSHRLMVTSNVPFRTLLSAPHTLVYLTVGEIPTHHVSLKSMIKLSPSATIFSTSLLPHVEQLPAMTLLQRGHTGLMHCVSISRTYPSGITRFVSPALPDIAVSRSRKLRSSYERQDFLDTNSTDELLQHVSENVYWTRAWIVQELVLAQQVIICIGPLFLDLDDFDWRTRPKWESVPTIRINPFWRLNRIRCGRLFNDKLSIRKSLIRLIEYFHDKQCSDPRDRIFSLLSIVRGEGEDLEVDYGLSRAELAFEVLRKCERSLCLCTAILVAQTLQLDIDGLEPDLRLLPCLEFCIKDIPVSSDFSQGRQRGVWEECVRSGLDFGATCRCSALYPWRLNPYLTYLDNAESLHRRPTQMEDITFRPVEGLDDIYIVRISLSFLATIVQHPVELCPDVQYKSKSDRFPVGYPRICYATDPLQPPGATDSSSLFVRLQSQPSGPVEKQSPAEYERFSWKQYSASILDAVKALRSSPLISIGRKYLWRDDPISGRIRSALIDNKEWLEVLEFERRKNGRDMNGFRYGLY
jgi:hypothetical protein